MPTPPTDRERHLRHSAAENGRWAEAELQLIETIRQHKRRLAELPDIIRRLEEERERVTAEMNRTGAEHDALEAAGDDFYVFVTGYTGLAGGTLEAEADDAEFRARADDMVDDYADFLLTTQPPRPNPLGLFKR